MTKPMRDQILAQPTVLRSLFDRRDELAGVLAGLNARPRRILAVGHGDSYFAPFAAAKAFETFTSIPYSAELSQELVAYPPKELDESVLVALSMSGKVGKTVAAATLARNRGARVLAVTNSPQSPITEVSDASFVLGIQEPAPFLAGSVTYTASLLALLLIALELGRNEDGLSALELAIRAVDAALRTEGEAKDLALAHSEAITWYFLGMGSNLATVHYATAKLVEIADTIGVAHETEEFFHEHHWIVRTDQPVIILAHDEPSVARGADAAAQLRELGVPVIVVGVPVWGYSGPYVPVPRVEVWCAPVVHAVPIQWLAYWLSVARGLDPDRRPHLFGTPRYEISRRYRS